MNILYAYLGFINPLAGGIQRVTHVMSNFFDSKGYNVSYVSFNRPEDNVFLGERQIYLPDSNSIVSKENIDFLRRILLEKKIDVIINQSGMSYKFSSLLCKASFNKVVLISCIHNSLLSSINNFSTTYYFTAKNKGLEKLLFLTDLRIIKKGILFLYKLKYRKHYRLLCSKSDKVVLLSDNFLPELNFFVGKRYDDKIIGINNPLSFINEVQKNQLLDKKKKELLYVGRIDKMYKRVDLLLEIWRDLFEDNNDWSLKIVGGGPDLEGLKEYAHSLGLERVKFTGFCEPEEFYESASVFCMTSSSEGFGIVLVEAMQYGVIPFSFDSYKSVFDIIDNNLNGVLIKSFSKEEYVSKLNLIMNNEAKAKTLANNSIVKSKNFSIEIIGNKWISLLNNLCRNK